MDINFFVTFPFRLPQKRHKYQLIAGAQTYDEARDIAFQNLDGAWAFVYPIAQLQDQVEQYELTELEPPLRALDHAVEAKHG